MSDPAALDRLIAAILAQAVRDAMDTCTSPYRMRRAQCAVMWLSERGCEFVTHLGGDEQVLTDYLSGARQPALHIWDS